MWYIRSTQRFVWDLRSGVSCSRFQGWLRYVDNFLAWDLERHCIIFERGKCCFNRSKVLLERWIAHWAAKVVRPERCLPFVHWKFPYKRHSVTSDFLLQAPFCCKRLSVTSAILYPYLYCTALVRKFPFQWNMQMPYAHAPFPIRTN